MGEIMCIILCHASRNYATYYQHISIRFNQYQHISIKFNQYHSSASHFGTEILRCFTASTLSSDCLEPRQKLTAEAAAPDQSPKKAFAVVYADLRQPLMTPCTDLAGRVDFGQADKEMLYWNLSFELEPTSIYRCCFCVMKEHFFEIVVIEQMVQRLSLLPLCKGTVPTKAQFLHCDLDLSPFMIHVTSVQCVSTISRTSLLITWVCSQDLKLSSHRNQQVANHTVPSSQYVEYAADSRKTITKDTNPLKPAWKKSPIVVPYPYKRL